MISTALPAIVEALIFAAELPLSRGQISSIVDSVDENDVVRIIDELNLQYELHRKPLKIVELAGGYQMVTREEYAEWIRRIFPGRFQGEYESCTATSATPTSVSSTA